jgi:cysteine desulfurase
VSRHYFDHASTSPPRPDVVAAMAGWLESAGAGEAAADPGRVHTMGRIARTLVEDGRDAVAVLLGVRPRQVVFTSGGTEAVNAAVWGATRARPGRPVVAADVEHSSVRAASGRAGEVVGLAVDGLGRIDLDDLDATLARLGPHQPAALVHCQAANHEVGTLQPVEAVVELCRRHHAWVHVDACAAAGHLTLDLDALGADLVSVSAHKLGGPPGIGALVLRRGLRIDPLVVGGDQERGRRAGLENTIGIVGFGAAAAALGAGDRLRCEADTARHQTKRIAAFATAVPGVTLLGDPSGRLPHLVCLTIAGVEAEPVLLGLDRAGIAVHSGSACSSESLTPSPVLEAMGADADHSLRISVGWSTTDEDVAALEDAFPRVVSGLRALRS